MGRVYEGVHRAIHRPVAVKVLHERIASDPVARARALAEGRAIGRLRHPHIVQIFDVEEHEGSPCLVMELLEGVTLAHHLESRGPLPVSQAIDIALPLVSALAAAHAVGVVHRDIKPSNVFLRRGRTVSPCLLDFGVSKVEDGTDSREPLTSSGVLLGSIPYFSPEHARGARNVTASSDQFSLAIIVYECITGVRPFCGKDQYELMIATVRAEAQPPSAIRPGIPPELDAVILRALRADPGARFPSMRAFGSALLAFADRDAWRAWAPELTGASPAAADPVVTQDDGSAMRALTAPVPPARRASKVPRRIATGAGIAVVAAIAAFTGYRAHGAGSVELSESAASAARPEPSSVALSSLAPSSLAPSSLAPSSLAPSSVAPGAAPPARVADPPASPVSAPALPAAPRRESPQAAPPASPSRAQPPPATPSLAAPAPPPTSAPAPAAPRPGAPPTGAPPGAQPNPASSVDPLSRWD
jgi:serine/threonine protein kinase